MDIEIVAEDRVRPDIVLGEPAAGERRLDGAFDRGGLRRELAYDSQGCGCLDCGAAVRTRKGRKHKGLWYGPVQGHTI